MRVCGVDLGNPGGIAVLTDEGDNGVRPLCTETLRPRMSRLELQRLVHRVCKEHRVELVATEKPGMWGRVSVGMAQREKQGLVRSVCEALAIPLVDYQPQSIKKAVTGHGRADKEQVGRCVRMLVRVASDDEHVLDACAIAIVGLNRERVRAARSGQRRLGLRRDRRRAKRR